MHDTLPLFATCARGLEPLLLSELQDLGAQEVKEVRAGVAFMGTLEIAYKVCLWSRLASRVLLPIASFPAPTTDLLYEGALSLPWADHLYLAKSFAVDVSTVRASIPNTQFAAQRVKDAVVDELRRRYGARPDVDPANAELRINVHIRDDMASLSIDLSGESLHRRGYRAEAGAAPLKENLAAALLWRADWPALSKIGGVLVDPMCGAGTLLIEAALMASNMAPGLLRETFGFAGWRNHDPELWRRLVEEARALRIAAPDVLIAGSDVDPKVVQVSERNLGRAGLGGFVRVTACDIAEAAPPEGAAGRPGVVVINPPYGERLSEIAVLKSVYASVGSTLRRRFAGYTALVLVEHEELGRRLGLRAMKRWSFLNGSLPCSLLKIVVPEATAPAAVLRSEAAVMFKNRLAKNFKHLKKWAKRIGVDAYRVYDADLPEYNVAVDVYAGRAVIQEYQAPPEIDPMKAAARFGDVMAVTPEVLGIEREAMTVKVRRRRAAGEQYEKLDVRGDLFPVHERDLSFLVNLTDYLDTGLFLDHRPTRALIAELARGKSFLNLFAYTGTATVAAAKGGATYTTTVDMSRTYLDWARQNLELNGIRGQAHVFVHADCLVWLEEARGAWDLIFLDPPTYSASKRMDRTLDLQRDHATLLRQAAALLAPGGTILFSCNFQRFKLDPDLENELDIKDITSRTIDEDFARQPKIHRAYLIKSRA